MDVDLNMYFDEERDCTKARICRSMGTEREAGQTAGNSANDSSQKYAITRMLKYDV